MAGLQRRILNLKNAYAQLQKAVVDPKAPRPSAVLFSSKEDFEINVRANQFEAQVLDFVKRAFAVTDANEKEEMKRRAANAYDQLRKFNLLTQESKDLNFSEMLARLDALARNKQVIKDKFRELDAMYKEVSDKRKEQLTTPTVVHGIIDQLYQQIRYDQLGNIAASLMKTRIGKLLATDPEIPPLPENKRRADNSEEGAIAEMLAANERRRAMPTPTT